MKQNGPLISVTFLGVLTLLLVPLACKNHSMDNIPPGVDTSLDQVQTVAFERRHDLSQYTHMGITNLIFEGGQGEPLAKTLRSTLSGQLRFQMASLAAGGRVNLNTDTGYWVYQPDITMTTDSFQVEAFNNKKQKEVIRIVINGIDTTAPVLLDTSPVNNARQVRDIEAIHLRFDDEMLLASIHGNGGTEDCSGSVQLSQNNFYSCIPLGAVTYSDGKNYRIHLASALSFSNQYHLKITTAVRNDKGMRLVQQQTISFFTALDRRTAKSDKTY